MVTLGLEIFISHVIFFFKKKLKRNPTGCKKKMEVKHSG